MLQRRAIAAHGRQHHLLVGAQLWRRVAQQSAGLPQTGEHEGSVASLRGAGLGHGTPREAREGSTHAMLEAGGAARLAAFRLAAVGIAACGTCSILRMSGCGMRE
eukprot:scaffold2269_cov221-Pinguiococcus_pyrenoidosus.AAC.9